jgi:type I restriction enzyme S subunit
MTKSSIPKDWQIVRFGELAESITERVDNPKVAGVEIYVGLEHLDSDTTMISRYGTPEDVESTKLRFYPGDVIYARRRAYQRKLGVAKVEGICSAHALVLRARPGVCLPEFLPFFLQSDQFHERALSISVGSLSPTINWKTLVVQEFVLPPIVEQQRIVRLIGAIDKAIDSYLAVPIEKLQEAILSEFFNDPKVKFSNLTLSECAELDMGQSPPGESYNITGDGMPFLQGSAEFGIKNPKPKKWTTSPTKVAEPGDLLISVRAPVGDVNFADRKVCIGRGLARIRETNLATTSFLVLALQYAHKDLTAASGTGMFSSISGANLKKIRVKVPSKDKQQQLVHAVALLENVADSLESVVSKSRLLRRACLNEFATSETLNV